MGIVRRISVSLTAPLAAGCLLASTTGVSPAQAAPPREPVGGPQLAGSGVIVNGAPGVPALPKIDAGSYMISDADTGEVLAAKNPHGAFLPASALKTLTSIALIPKLDRKALIRPSQKACDVEGTKVGMTPKLKYPVEDLFRALLMVSANDAALTLAQAGGGLKNTLATMNAEAKRLQANDTLAGSPNGLDVDLGLTVKTQHTSAYDLSLIMKQGLRLPDFREYVGTVNAKFPAEPPKLSEKDKKAGKKPKKTASMPIYSHDRLLPTEGYAYQGMIGGKNGYTVHAGQTFVGAARRNGHTVIVSLMRGEVLWANIVKLLNWGFAADGKVKPIGTLVDPVDTAKKDEGTGDGGGILPVGPLKSKSSSVQWTLVAAGTGLALVVAGGLVVLVRRRRRHAPAGSPAEGAFLGTGDSGEAATDGSMPGDSMPGGRAADDASPSK
ncbi:D-alanyl-D-alanine carboxypeptidase family protein [Actinomadura scrupuli]|uniref:D-alanyl-D-alanine carboxypeptidase family protein n=1 Tax=Actinomadura scrupuli TaxID=559629 RepID=UPI003D95790A